MEAILIGILEKFFNRRIMAVILFLRGSKDVESWLRTSRHDRREFFKDEGFFHGHNLSTELEKKKSLKSFFFKPRFQTILFKIFQLTETRTKKCNYTIFD